MRTALIAIHASFAALWLGCILTEALFERALLSKGRDGQLTLAHLHVSVDKAVELPAIIGVLVSGFLLLGQLGAKLLVLGHHYQQDDVIRHADLIGDSLKLSQMAAAEAPPANPLPPPPINPVKALRQRARRDVLLFAAVFLAVAAIGVGAYFYLTSSPAAPAAAEPPQAAAPAVASNPAPPAPAVVAAPAAVAPPPKPAEPPPAPPASVPVETAPSPSLAPAAVPAQAPAPSPRFLRYTEGLRVSGVYQGEPARALVDGRVVREGDVIEPALGVVFHDVDARTKHLILRDASGAEVLVKY